MRTQRPIRPAPEWIDEIVGHVVHRTTQVLAPASPAARVARVAARISSPSFARTFDLRPATRRTAQANHANRNHVTS